MLRKLVALLLVALLSPIFIIVAVLIFIEDGSPVLFEQKRIGVNCSFFRIVKFRTMKKGTPNVATHLLDDPNQYILSIGKILRKSSLDELPNLINIINGDMAFIGPRPALFNQIDLMELRVLHGIDVLLPGITGWAQINGRDEISLEKKIALEKEYLIKQSFGLDCLIIIRTVVNTLFKINIHH